jgi:putative restriction endonuclease
MPADAVVVEHYTQIKRPDALAQLSHIVERSFPVLGRRQEPFVPVETLLCYGLFFVLDPHRYGGRNADRMPDIVRRLATFFRRSPGSIQSKMLNLDGSRVNSARAEPTLFAILTNRPALYQDIYLLILSSARELGIANEVLPNFLEYHENDATPAANATQVLNNTSLLLGQDELPQSATELLTMAEREVDTSTLALTLGEQTTEKLLLGRIRLTQHRFATNVLKNWQRTCVFCGASFHTLPERSGLLHASHIKPWARSTAHERTDVRNGFAACPTHDAAFDRGYITVLPDHRIVPSRLIQESIRNGDPLVQVYFREVLRDQIEVMNGRVRPHPAYLAYHRDNIFRH